MAKCPNTSSPQWQELVSKIGVRDAYKEFLIHGDVPDPLGYNSTLKGVNATLKIVDALSSDKTQQLYNRFYKSNPEKFYSELIPLAGKQQVDLLRSYNNKNNPYSLQDMLTGIMADISYTVEVSTAKGKTQYTGPDMRPIEKYYSSSTGLTYVYNDYLGWSNGIGDYVDDLPKDATLVPAESENSSFYSNLTVPGGTNYTENEIKTPDITPSIKGHAQFSTDNGIGWFRSDDKKKDTSDSSWRSSRIIPEYDEAGNMIGIPDIDIYEGSGESSKTRRILELQSDLFQKGRDKGDLVAMNMQKSTIDDLLSRNKISQKEYDDYLETIQRNSNKNNFLQLLNKDGNWIPFFIKTIVQDSAKKGYEKVLFPTGDTASKVEGHETLEEFKKQKEDRIKVLSENNEYNKQQLVSGKFVGKGLENLHQDISTTDSEIKQLQEELKRVESEGFAALKPIYDFYENRVKNTLNKIYGKENVTRIKDEYGNEWYQVDIEQKRDKSTIYYQLDTTEVLNRIYKGFQNVVHPIYQGKMFVGLRANKGVSANKTVATAIQKWIDKIPEFSNVRVTISPTYGTINFQDKITGRMYQLASESQEPADPYITKKIKGFMSSLSGNIRYRDDIIVNGERVSANAMVDVVKRTIEIVSGREKMDTLPEEAAHIYVHWLPSNSALLRDMLRDIKNRPEYDKVMAQYSTNPLYQNSDGTVNEEKIAIEAIGKVIAGVIVGKVKDKKAMSWWQKILSWLTGIFKGEDYDAYQVAASDILAGRVKNLDMKAMKEANQKGEIYFSLSEDDQKLVDKQLKNATKEQKEAVDKLIVSPENRVLPEGAIYTDDKGNEYQSIDSKVGDIFNAQQGSLSGDNYIDQYSVDGNIAFPQVSVATPYDPDPSKRVAGTVPVLVIHPNGEVSVIDVTDSTNKIANSVKAGSYTKMLSLMGFNVRNNITRDSSNSSIVQHEDSANRDIIDSIVSGEWQGKQAIESDNPTHDQEFADTTNDEKIEPDPNSELALEERVIKIYQAVESWRAYIKNNMKYEVGFRPQDQTLAKIDELLGVLESHYNKGDKSLFLTEFLKFGNEELNKIINYLGSTNDDGTLKNINSPDYIHIAQLAYQYVQTFKGLEAAATFANDAQHVLIARVQDSMQRVQNVIIEAFKNVVNNNVLGLSNNPDVENLRDEVAKGVGKDIGFHDNKYWGWVENLNRYLGDMANVGNPILENLDKAYKSASERVRESTEEYADRLHAAGNELSEALGTKDSKVMYDKLIKKDKNGKRTGMLVGPIGTAYIDKEAEVTEPLINDDLTWKEYITVKDPSAARVEDVEWNKELWYLKQERRKFMEPEKREKDEFGDWVVEDGDYHRYTDEFKAERAHYMRINSYGHWVPKKNNAEFIAWRKKNFTYETYTTVRTKNGKPTGQTEFVADDRAYFPNKEHVVVRDVATNGHKLYDPMYAKLKNPQTAEEKALSKFYFTYRDIIGQLMEGLPSSAQWWFEKGYIPTLSSNFIKLLTSKDKNTMEVITKELRDMFSVTSYTQADNTKKGGSATHRIPILFMGSLQNQANVKKIQEAIGNLDANKNSMPSKAYKDERKRLSDILKKEQDKVLAEDIHPDLVLGGVAFAKSAENFRIMSELEDTILATKTVIENTHFAQKDGTTKTGMDSSVAKRFKYWMDMTFYNDATFNKDIAEVLTKRIMNYTSLVSIPLHIFGNINNMITGTYNNFLQTVGGDMYRRQSMVKMQKEFPKALAGIVKNKAAFWSDDTKKYGKKKAATKYEALAEHYNMARKYQEEQGKISLLEAAYMTQEGPEWMIQTKVGNSILDSIMVKNDKGEELSVYDAWDFDPNTGKLSMKKGFPEETKAEKHARTNRIWESNKVVHGNYAFPDRPVLKKHWLGQLAMQFHNFFWPNLLERIRPGKFDENIGGGMEREGRYITIASFLAKIRETQSLLDGWHKLSLHQKANLRKDGADIAFLLTAFAIGHIIKSLAADIPDDDPYLKKFTHFLQYQSDRSFQEAAMFTPIGTVEAYQLFKNPFAISSTLKNFGEAVQTAYRWPFQTDEERYIQKGSHEGMSHLQKELRDLVPIWNNINQWEAFDNINTFYIQ